MLFDFTRFLDEFKPTEKAQHPSSQEATDIEMEQQNHLFKPKIQVSIEDKKSSDDEGDEGGELGEGRRNE